MHDFDFTSTTLDILNIINFLLWIFKFHFTSCLVMFLDFDILLNIRIRISLFRAYVSLYKLCGFVMFFDSNRRPVLTPNSFEKLFKAMKTQVCF